MMSFFEALLGFHPPMSNETNCDLQSKSQIVDKNVVILCDLIKKLKVNLAESEKLQIQDYHNYGKEHAY